MRLKLAVALALAGAWMLTPTAAATVVCPPGVNPPSPYCSNVAPTATTGAATGVTGTRATLHGTAGSAVVNGDETFYVFQWGKTTAYGSFTPVGTIPRGPATAAVSANLTGLTRATTYHYRLIAFNPDGSTFGADRTFRTARL